MEFTPLYIRSGYSFLKSGLTIDRIFSKLLKEGYSSAALCDYKVLFGIPSFVNQGKKDNIHTIIGLECVLVVNSHHFNICLYASNENGYRNLIKISSMISRTDTLDVNYLKEHCDGLICVMTSSQGSFKEIIDNKSQESLTLLSKISSLFSYFYLGLEVYSLEDNEYATMVRGFAFNYGYKVVAFP